jgi:hypothetical protein
MYSHLCTICIHLNAEIQDFVDFIADKRFTFLILADWLCLRLRVWVRYTLRLRSMMADGPNLVIQDADAMSDPTSNVSISEDALPEII